MTPYVKPKVRRKNGKAPKPHGTLSARLGDLILQQTPYPNPDPLKISRAAGLKMYGPGRRFTAAKAYTIPDVRSKKARLKNAPLPKALVKKILRSGPKWDVGGVLRRMSKVMRIPYNYKDPVDKKKAKAALVIGWEGAGGGM